jgi:sigma-B regulation protein RsbQ
MVGPSPCYIDDQDYVGGFSAPAIMGNPERPELGETLTNSFCATDPEIARDFARVTFLSDNRSDLPNIKARTLVLQCKEDIIAPICVGEYVRDNIPNSGFMLLDATGHCPNLSAPDEVTAAIRAFV